MYICCSTGWWWLLCVITGVELSNLNYILEYLLCSLSKMTTLKEFCAFLQSSHKMLEKQQTIHQIMRSMSMPNETIIVVRRQLTSTSFVVAVNRNTKHLTNVHFMLTLLLLLLVSKPYHYCSILARFCPWDCYWFPFPFVLLTFLGGVTMTYAVK